MIETTTTVVKTDGHRVWVAGGQNSACDACGQKTGCTVNAIDTILKKKAVAVDSQITLHVGDRVVVEIDENLLLRASLLQYFLPVIAMFTGAGLAEPLLANVGPYRELWVAGAALSALALSLWLINRLQKLWLFSFYAVPLVVKKIL